MAEKSLTEKTFKQILIERDKKFKVRNRESLLKLAQFFSNFGWTVGWGFMYAVFFFCAFVGFLFGSIAMIKLGFPNIAVVASDFLGYLLIGAFGFIFIAIIFSIIERFIKKRETDS